jgi:Lipocalin-like domain
LIDRSGHFSIVIVRADIPKFASNNREKGTAEENQAAVHGSLAYFGTYAVDEANHALTVRIESSTYPNFEGSEQKRLYTLSGDTLTLANPTPSAGGGTAVQVRRRAR